VAEVEVHPRGNEATIAAYMVRVRRDWLDQDLLGMQQLLQRWTECIAAAGKQQYAAACALFRLAALARASSDLPSIHDAVEELLASPYCGFAMRLFPDVAAIAIRAGKGHPNTDVRQSSLWKVETVDHEHARSGRLPGSPREIAVWTLQSTLRINIDSVPYRGGWNRALDLLLYLVHNRAGGTAHEVGAALWGRLGNEHAAKQRFHTMVAALRNILGSEAIVRTGSGWPASYALNPQISVTYDLAEFKQRAADVLAFAPDSAPAADAIGTALSLYRAPYWPASHWRGSWFQTVADEAEATRRQLWCLLNRRAPGAA
jgi:hypothetical protein